MLNQIGTMAATQESCVMCSHVKLFKPVLSLFLIISLVNRGSSLGDSNLLNIVDQAVNSGKTSNDIGILWGIPDVTAHVGHLFNYSIPSDAFKGHPQSLEYMITEAGKNELPSWLSFDAKKQVLQGVPLPTDIKQHYIEVIATDKNNANSQAKDIFTIDVVSERNSQPSTTLTFAKGGPKMVRCKREQPETKVTLILDADLEKLSSNDRLDLMNRFSHLNLIPEMLKMIPVDGKPVIDDTALVSGPGNVKFPTEPGVFVSWRVGCGTVDPGHLPILQQVESSAQNGQLAEALKHPILTWHVTNSRFQEHKRHRRAIRATPLATPSVLPTIPTQPPTMTKPIDEMTRPVIGEASPTFTIEPSRTTPMMKTAEPEKTTPKMPGKKPTTGLEPSRPEPTPTDSGKTMPLPKETITPTKPTTDSKPTDLPPGCIPDLPPEVRNPFRRIDFMAGEFSKYKIPADTFYDCEVGNTRKLKLDLYANSTDPIPKNFWLKLEQKRQQIVAFPTPTDAGVHKFTLVARKGNKGLMETHTFRVKVKGGSARELASINHEVSITLDIDYDEFMSNITNRMHLVHRLAKAFGDHNTKSIQLTKIERGSVIIGFTNTSLSGSDCPIDDLKTMFSNFMNDDGTIKPEAAKHLKPYKIQQAGTVPKGACENNPNFPELLSPFVTPAPKPEPPSKGDENVTTPMPETTTENIATGSAKSGDDIWITTVVPAVVIVAILLIALLVACILYRKKRKGKMSLEDKNTFVNKGVPVILPDELDENEKQQESSKPLIMPEEKPPITSPEYRAGSSEASTPPANHRNMMADDQYIEDVHSPLYQPPPPVQSSGGNKQPRPHMQSYNKPTAYVPP